MASLPLKCCFLSERNFAARYGAGYVQGELLVADALRELGWEVDPFVPWQDTCAASEGSVVCADTAEAPTVVNLSQYRFALLRTIWDYAEHPKAFAAFLDTMERRAALSSSSPSCTLVNSPSIVRWNMSKHYLRETAEAGVPTIPTIFWEPPSRRVGGMAPPLKPSEAILAAFAGDFKDSEVLVVKPAISAGSMFTYRVTREKLTSKQGAAEEGSVAKRPNATVASALDWERTLEEAEVGYESAGIDTFADLIDFIFLKGDRTMLIQPFITTVPTHGEYSVLLFGGEVSHMVKKVPVKGDFRVQGAFGAHEAHVARDDPMWGPVSTLGTQLYAYLAGRAYPTSVAATGTSAVAGGDSLPPIYLRIDVVFAAKDLSPMMIEAELIEPYLYFAKGDGNGERPMDGPRLFAKALDRQFRSSQ